MKLFMRVFPESDNTLKSITVGRKCNLYCTRKRLYYASVFLFWGVFKGFFFGTLVNINIVNTYVINIFRPFFSWGFPMSEKRLIFYITLLQKYIFSYLHTFKKIALHLIS